MLWLDSQEQIRRDAQRDRVKRRVLVGVAAFAVAGTLIVSGVRDQQAHDTYEQNHPVPATTCTEDMPCWNCQTMGNHVCGTLP